MRDIALFIYFVLMVLIAIKRPGAGIALWIWTALLTPNYLVFGFADSVRYNLISAIVTIGVYFFHPKKDRNDVNCSLAIFVYLFLFWTAVSSYFSIYESYIISRELDRFFRGILLFLFALLVLNNKSHLTMACWGIVLSIGFYSGVEGLKYISSGATHHIFGPSGSNLRDNNHLALAINMMLPFAIFLLKDVKNKLIKLGFMSFLAVSVVSIVGTNSRGGFVGLAILAIAWLVFSKHKIVLGTFMLITVITLLSFVPESYSDRIGSIAEAEDDNSFEGRIVAWKQSTLIAMDNPLTGGGFYAVQTTSVWQHYVNDFYKLDFIESLHASGYNFKAAHSIYFQVLGDQGFVGFFLFFSIFLTAGIKALRISMMRNLDKSHLWIKDLSLACFMSLLSFGVCGALLSLAYFELSYFIVAMIIVLDRKVASGNLNRNTMDEASI